MLRIIFILKLNPIIANKSSQLVFVVQKHDATRLHYDFRLQIGEAMPSWAIPKGPSLDNSVKRLAMQTPDHELSYRTFEGNLPEGSVGAGPVMIWDAGYYIPEIEITKGVREKVEDIKKGQEIMMEGMKKGELKFTLLGERLKGSFALIKTRGFAGKDAWLMIKHKDEFVEVNFDAHKIVTSIVSKKTIEEIRAS